MPSFNYAFHYEQWHDNSPNHRRDSVTALAGEFSHVSASLPPGGRALDVGCGHGFLLDVLVDLGYEVEGTEIDLNAASVARAAGHTVHMIGDLEQLPRQEDGLFSVITLFDVLEHVPREAQLPLLAQCWRLLADGGMLLIRTPNAVSPAAGYMRFVDWTHEMSFTTYSLTPLLRSAKFVNVSFRRDRPARQIAGRRRAPLLWISSRIYRQMLASWVGPDILTHPMEPNLTVTARKPAKLRNKGDAR